MATTKTVKEETPTDRKFLAGNLLSRQLGLELVTITVGKDTNIKTFAIHKALLCKHVAPFDRMFNGPFLEGTTQSAQLPEDTSQAFELFVGWLYRGDIETIEVADTGDVSGLISLVCFAEKYDIQVLADKAKNRILGRMFSHNWVWGSSQIDICYARTTSTSKLRVLAARYFVFVSLSKTTTTLADCSTDELCRVLQKHEDLTKDVLALMREQNGILVTDPKLAPLCDYHLHSKDGACPYPRYN